LGNILPFVKDDDTNNVWVNWQPENRDLFFFRQDGVFHTKLNLTSGFNVDQIKQIINSCILDCTCESGGDAELDNCGVCNGDNSSCSGCTDPNAENYVPGATIDDGSCESLKAELLLIPEKISIQTYPNPFNPSTNIILSIPIGSHFDLSVYDVRGRLIETLSHSYFTPGNYTLTWNAAEYISGIYFIRLESNDYSISQKLALVK